MAPEVSATMGLMRLADQVQALSELTEALTYRLLELEEKVAALDLKLQPLISQSSEHSGAAARLASDTGLRLDETEERLARLEALLSGHHGVAPCDDVEPEQPFPDDDGEQPFLDDELFADESIASGDLVDERHHNHDDGYEERLSA